MQSVPPPPPPPPPPVSMPTCYRHPDQPAGVVCQRCDRPICPRCMNQASVGFHCPECTKAGAQKVYVGVQSLYAQPVVTMTLIGLNVVVFVLSVIQAGSDALSGSGGELHVDYGLIAKFSTPAGYVYPGEGVGEGQWYRMVTSGFLHYGLLHLAFNMYALWILGRVIEHVAGRLGMATIYGVGLLGGSLGALALSPGSLTAGASGAIYGLMGAVLVVQWAQGVPLRNSPVLVLLVINAVITVGVPGLSIGGHLGGLIGGALAALVLFVVPQRSPMPKWAPYAICAGIALAIVVAGVAVSSSYAPGLG